jgi:hypothetical protein
VEKVKANTEAANTLDRNKWEEDKRRDTKAAYKDYLSKFSNGMYKDSANAKIEAINLKFKPVKEALIAVKAGFAPSNPDVNSTKYIAELDLCLKKAIEGTLTEGDIKTLWKVKRELNGYEGKGISELKIAVKELFNFDPDLTRI